MSEGRLPERRVSEERVTERQEPEVKSKKGPEQEE